MSGTYAVIAWDAPGSGALRDTTRDAHFAHFEKNIDKFLIAGPLKNADGSFAGSLVVVKAGSEAEAEEILRSDPYYIAGVWDRWEIKAFTPAAGDWIGGKIW